MFQFATRLGLAHRIQPVADLLSGARAVALAEHATRTSVLQGPGKALSMRGLPIAVAVGYLDI